MLTQSTGSTGQLLNLSAQHKIIPIVESRTQLLQALETSAARTIFLRHCNLFEIAPLLEQAHRRKRAMYVHIDHIDGIHPDSAGLRYLARQLHITGIISTNPRILALAKDAELEAVQRVFAVDSTGLEAALETVDPERVDLLDIAPAPVVPHIIPYLSHSLPLPFTASGLIFTFKQAETVLNAGALAVAVTKSELWSF